MLQKKLNQKKFLTEDLNKWSTMPETERRKNEIPKAYVSFEHYDSFNYFNVPNRNDARMEFTVNNVSIFLNRYH